MTLIFVDCEAVGGAPSVGKLTEFGAVEYVPCTDPRREQYIKMLDSPQDPGPVGETFHGIIYRPVERDGRRRHDLTGPLNDPLRIFREFDEWLLYRKGLGGSLSFVSDNVAYDWQWINDGLWRYCERNLLGHSGRRISDFYAGLTGDFRNTQRWKRLRRTRHDHNPVNDAIGNVEAFDRIMRGER